MLYCSLCICFLGYTIIVPAKVFVDGGVNVNLDLEIDQETVSTGPSRKSKDIETTVSSRFTETGTKASQNGVTLHRVVRVPASQSDRDIVTSPDSVSDSARMDACNSHEKDGNSGLVSLELIYIYM